MSESISVRGHTITRETDGTTWQVLAPGFTAAPPAPHGWARYQARAIATTPGHPPRRVTVTMGADVVLAWEMAGRRVYLDDA